MSEQALRLEKVKVTRQTKEARLSGGVLLVMRIAWFILGLAVVGVLIASLPHYVAKVNGQLEHVAAGASVPGARIFAAAGGVASFASAMLSFGLSVLLFRRKFSEPIAAFLSFFLLLYGVVMSGPLEFAGTYWLGSAEFALVAQSVLLTAPMLALLMLFPTGRFVPGWTRWIVLLSAPLSFGFLLLAPFGGESLSARPILSTVLVGFIGCAYLIGVYAQIFRYRNASSDAERQQIRWAVYGFVLLFVYIFVSTIPYFYLTGLPPDAATPWWAPASELGWWLSLSILPVCLTVAITRHRLWDIDVVINRTLVYGALTASVLVLYALIVGGIGLLFRTNDNVMLPLLATGLAAFLFHPWRERLQRAVNRLMYGERDEPFDVLARLGQRLESTLSPGMVYPTIVETVAQVLKLPYVALTVQQGEGFETVESYGRPSDDLEVYPLSHHGEVVGRLLVAQRGPDEAFSPADERILRNIARQAGAAVHAAQLTTDLQRSRQRLVTAREEERRRLRRDLHDGLGPTLAAQMFRLGSARALLATNPEAADRILAQLEGQTERTLAEIRRLVYNLRPPALDQLGLAAAVREYAAQYNGADLSVTVEAPDSLPSLPAAVEVAAYRIVQEAVTNVVHHAEAGRCRVTLVCDRGLRVTVRDDGQGLPADYRMGVGLSSMQERAAELGGDFRVEAAPAGGTEVTAILPLVEVSDEVSHEVSGEVSIGEEE